MSNLNAQLAFAGMSDEGLIVHQMKLQCAGQRSGHERQEFGRGEWESIPLEFAPPSNAFAAEGGL